MKMKFKPRTTANRITLCAFVTFSGVVAAAADLTSFTPGDLVIMRGGDAAHSQSTYAGGEVPAYLDEYTTSGAYVGSYAIPSDVLTLPGLGTASHEGRLELSTDGHYLDFAGYHQAVDPSTARSTFGDAGSSNTAANTPDPTYYQIGQISGSGAFMHSALDTSVAFPQYLRVAYSNDGQEVWVGSKYNGSTGSGIGGGLDYVANFSGAAVGDTTSLQGATDWRDLKVNAGQLFGGTGSSAVGTHGFYAIGSGAPTGGMPANTRLTGTNDNSASNFSFVTLPGGGQSITGASGAPNTVYTVGDPSGTAYIGKLYSAGGTPLTQDNLTFASRQVITSQISSPEGIVTQIDPNNPAWVDLYVQNASGIYFAVDKSGTSNGSFGTLTFSQIVGNSSDTNFYGLAFAPAPLQLKGDLNFDGHVDAKDILAMEQALVDLNAYVASESGNGVTRSNLASFADMNGDGNVNNADLQGLLKYLKDGNGSLSAVPEPSGLVLISLALVALVRIGFQRRRIVVDGSWQRAIERAATGHGINLGESFRG